MLDPIKQTIDGVKLVICIVFAVVLFGAIGSCNYYMDKAEDLEHKIALSNEQNKTLENKYIAEAFETEVKYKKQEIVANEKYAQDIKAIYADAVSNRNVIERVYNNHTETIKHLPEMERSAVEDIVKTKSERLVEGATLLAEVSGIAHEYNAELEACIAKYPKPPAKVEDK